ncbi:MAG: hypothetical protein WKG07_27045 [Hymenobacter sp.]
MRAHTPGRGLNVEGRGFLCEHRRPDPRRRRRRISRPMARTTPARTWRTGRRGRCPWCRNCCLA